MEVKKYLSKEQIIGKQVIDLSATAIGTVIDLAFDLAGREIAVPIRLKDERKLTVLSSDVSNVGDVVLLNKVVDSSSTPPSVKRIETVTLQAETPLKPGLCKVRNFQNDDNTRFCIKCGAKLS